MRDEVTRLEQRIKKANRRIARQKNIEYENRVIARLEHRLVEIKAERESR
jgi:hypothetical protein